MDFVHKNFPRSPELLNMYGVRYLPIGTKDLIAIQDISDLLEFKNCKPLYDACKRKSPISRFDETAAKSNVGAVERFTMINVLENDIGGPKAKILASEMRGWGERVPAPQPKVEAPLVTANVPAVVPTGSFAIAGFAIKQDAEGRYCLNDLHKAAGNIAKDKPSEWIRNSQTSDLVEEISKAVLAAIKPPSFPATCWHSSWSL